MPKQYQFYYSFTSRIKHSFFSHFISLYSIIVIVMKLCSCFNAFRLCTMSQSDQNRHFYKTQHFCHLRLHIVLSFSLSIYLWIDRVIANELRKNSPVIKINVSFFRALFSENLKKIQFILDKCLAFFIFFLKRMSQFNMNY